MVNELKGFIRVLWFVIKEEGVGEYGEGKGSELAQFGEQVIKSDSVKLCVLIQKY